MAPERRHSLRQKVNTPAFASFDGVTGGMILDLSEEAWPLQTQATARSAYCIPLHLSLGEPAVYLETTGYVAWADALGRAGVRFSDLPDEARARLREWLTVNAGVRKLEGAAMGSAELGFGQGRSSTSSSAGSGIA